MPKDISTIRGDRPVLAGLRKQIAKQVIVSSITVPLTWWVFCGINHGTANAYLGGWALGAVGASLTVPFLRLAWLFFRESRREPRRRLEWSIIANSLLLFAGAVASYTSTPILSVVSVSGKQLGLQFVIYGGILFAAGAVRYMTNRIDPRVIAANQQQTAAKQAMPVIPEHYRAAVSAPETETCSVRAR